MLDAATSPRIHTTQRDTAPAPSEAPTPCGNRPTSPRWHVVYTHPQAERRATHHLTEQGYAAYLPLITVRRRDNAIRSLLHRVQVPLFPRYAFVRFDAAHDPWLPITNTLGVRSLLCRPDGTPQPVARGAISALRAAEAFAATQQLPGTSWAPGVPCSLRKDMPLGGLPAVVLSAGHDMALIAVMFLGQLREVTVGLDCLMPREEV